jgi:hypothetical protein
MALKDWTPQLIKRLWLRGVLLESALILVAVLLAFGFRFTHRDDFRKSPHSLAHAIPLSELPASTRDSTLRVLRPRLDSAGISLRIAGDTTTLQLNDSMDAAFINHPDTLGSVHLSAAASRATKRMLSGLGRAASAVWWQFIVIAGLIYLPIPIGLAVLTVTWAVQRREAAT